MENMQQYAEEIHRPVKRKFMRRSITAVAPNDIWSIDLLDVSNIREYNDDVTFLLIVIDVYSRYAYAVPLKTKKPKDVVNAIESMKVTPYNIWSDQGGEFYNTPFKKYCKDNNINHYHTFSGLKSVFAERFNRTIREIMAKYFTKSGNLSYLDKLDDFIDGYNNKVHSSIRKKPIEVYLHSAKPYNKIKFINAEPKYRVGDHVRISRVKGTFEKGYTPRWSKEVFVIKNIDSTQYPTMYELEDLMGEELTGLFYEDELQVTNLKDHAVVEKIVSTKTVKGKKMYLVKYDGYGDKFNEWLTESQLKNIRD